MNIKYWMLLAGMLVALGAQITGLEHGWHDAVTPMFIGGILGQFGVLVASVFVDPPERKE